MNQTEKFLKTKKTNLRNYIKNGHGTHANFINFLFLSQCLEYCSEVEELGKMEIEFSILTNSEIVLESLLIPNNNEEFKKQMEKIYDLFIELDYREIKKIKIGKQNHNFGFVNFLIYDFDEEEKKDFFKKIIK